MEDDEPSDVEYVLAMLLDAQASGLTLDDVIKVGMEADCLGCWMDAVSMLGIGAIDPGDYLVVYVTKEE